jgi:hypothetical protein
LSIVNNRWPRVVGIDVPKLLENVDNATSEAVTILLDIEPSQAWVDEFRVQVTALVDALGASAVVIDASTIRFFGSIRDARTLAASVRLLMDSVSTKLQNTAPQALPDAS